ncbi:MAG: hypothetical protein ABFD10_04755 [Prolixibacteraceae bacterium]
MNDPIKNIIQTNREAFDAEPPEGHFGRFQLKLEKTQKKRRMTVRSWLEIAAAVLIIVLAGNQARIYFSNNSEKEAVVPTLSSVSPEYQEVEYYYTSAIDEGMTHLKKLQEQGVIPPEEQQMMELEMKEFRETYARLQKDLKANPEDERVIQAMLEVYQSKLSIITLIINKLETVKQQKKTNHEAKI